MAFGTASLPLTSCHTPSGHLVVLEHDMLLLSQHSLTKFDLVLGEFSSIFKIVGNTLAISICSPSSLRTKHRDKQSYLGKLNEVKDKL